MPKITDIGNDRLDVKVTLELVNQTKNCGDLCEGCFFNNNDIANCPTGSNGFRCSVSANSKWVNYIWVEV